MQVHSQTAVSTPIKHPKRSLVQGKTTWNIPSFCSSYTDTTGTETLLLKYIRCRRTTLDSQNQPRLTSWTTNQQAFYNALIEKSPILKKIYQALGSHKQLFIHAICDATQLYLNTSHPKVYYLVTVANGLLPYLQNMPIHKYEDINISTSHYAKEEDTIRPVFYGNSFGNVLFRFSHDGEILFSPLFKTDTSIAAKATGWETITEVEYPPGKILKYSDAVAHYRWLTEVATPEEFNKYSLLRGYTNVHTDDTLETRKAILKELASQYWSPRYIMPASASPTPIHRHLTVFSPKQRHGDNGFPSLDESTWRWYIDPLNSIATETMAPQLRTPERKNVTRLTLSREDAANSDSADNESTNGTTSRQRPHRKNPRRHHNTTYPHRYDDFYRGYPSSDESQTRETSHTHIRRSKKGDVYYITHNHYHYSESEVPNTTTVETSPFKQPVTETVGTSPFKRTEENHHLIPVVAKRVTPNATPDYIQTAKRSDITTEEKLPVATPITTEIPETKIIYLEPIQAKRVTYFVDTIHKKHKGLAYRFSSRMNKFWHAFKIQ
jgi:hypothetical protein